MEGGCGPPGLYAARSAREPAGKGYSGYSTQETDATPNIIEHVTDLYQDTSATALKRFDVRMWLEIRKQHLQAENH
ncbi:hypothetical protein PSHT_15714 [Puccinia striiformis]|uniref:Uncharacterized protein n=1 Tax=Puccinia striiformis TaxID=27350 RepID=A0A2S4UDD2_9BASI|nr:hypothetical protein PSHT_15714 [Puccinia striiformis]